MHIVKIPNFGHSRIQTMEEIRKHFPALSTCVYLNTAANGIVPAPVIEWRRKHDVHLMEHASVFRDSHKQHLQQIRKTLAVFLGGPVEEIALVPNFSFGINMVLEGLPEGQKILVLKNDYPSVNWPVETRDFNVCYAEIDENLERNVEAAVSKHKPDVFIFSLVQWLNGIKMDFDFLKQLKEEYPNLLIIADGTQYLGTEDFNFTDSAIDVLCASGYKWLTSGYGNGFLMIKKTARNRIFPRTIGFNSAEKFESAAKDTLYMKHFEPGHQDTLTFGSMEQSILFMESLGKARVFGNIKHIATKAKEKFSEMGLLKNDVLLRENHSPIFNLRADIDLFQKLKENNIVASLRGGGIRVSFHYYNCEEDLDRLTGVLDR